MTCRSAILPGVLVLAACSGPSSQTAGEKDSQAARSAAPLTDSSSTRDSRAAARAPTGPEGTMSFTYSSTMTSGSTFSASGALPGSADEQATHEWAAGTRDEEAEKTRDEESAPTVPVVGSRPTTTGSYDFAVLELGRATNGLAPIDTGGCYGNCPGLVVYFRTADAPTPGQITCTVVKGVIQVDVMSSVRASGTFSGTGGCADDEGNTSPFAVTNGVFNVALLKPDRFGTVTLSR
jgi:hypothetical protein